LSIVVVAVINWWQFSSCANLKAAKQKAVNNTSTYTVLRYWPGVLMRHVTECTTLLI